MRIMSLSLRETRHKRTSRTLHRITTNKEIGTEPSTVSHRISIILPKQL